MRTAVIVSLLGLLFGFCGARVFGQCETEGSYFVRGDLNSDCSVNTTDMVWMDNLLSGGWPQPWRLDRADVNDDGSVNISDMICLAQVISGAYIPPAPYPEMGLDCTPDNLDNCRSPALGVDYDTMLFAAQMDRQTVCHDYPECDCRGWTYPYQVGETWYPITYFTTYSYAFFVYFENLYSCQECDADIFEQVMDYTWVFTDLYATGTPALTRRLVQDEVFVFDDYGSGATWQIAANGPCLYPPKFATVKLDFSDITFSLVLEDVITGGGMPSTEYPASVQFDPGVDPDGDGIIEVELYTIDMSGVRAARGPTSGDCSFTPSSSLKDMVVDTTQLWNMTGCQTFYLDSVNINGIRLIEENSWLNQGSRMAEDIVVSLRVEYWAEADICH
jgi:hypothetical protein